MEKKITALCTFRGQDVYVTNYKVSVKDKIKGLYYYDLRHGSNQGYPVALEDFVVISHWGTLISREPIKLESWSDERVATDLTSDEINEICDSLMNKRKQIDYDLICG